MNKGYFILLGLVLLAGCAATESFNYSACNSLTPIFSDDFEGNLSKWNDLFGSGVFSVSDGLLKAKLETSDDNPPAFIYASGINPYNGNYSMSGYLKLSQGVLILLLRANGVKGYSLWLSENKAVLLKQVVDNSPPTLLDIKDVLINNGTWINFKAVTFNNRIILFIKGVKVIDYADPENTFSYGNYSLGVHNKFFDNVYDSGTAYFDNLTITEVNESTYLC